jgi:hypothetical protein
MIPYLEHFAQALIAGWVAIASIYYIFQLHLHTIEKFDSFLGAVP